MNYNQALQRIKDGEEEIYNFLLVQATEDTIVLKVLEKTRTLITWYKNGDVSYHNMGVIHSGYYRDIDTYGPVYLWTREAFPFRKLLVRYCPDPGWEWIYLRYFPGQRIRPNYDPEHTCRFVQQEMPGIYHTTTIR